MHSFTSALVPNHIKRATPTFQQALSMWCVVSRFLDFIRYDSISAYLAEFLIQPRLLHIASKACHSKGIANIRKGISDLEI